MGKKRFFHGHHKNKHRFCRNVNINRVVAKNRFFQNDYKKIILLWPKKWFFQADLKNVELKGVMDKIQLFQNDPEITSFYSKNWYIRTYGKNYFTKYSKKRALFEMLIFAAKWTKNDFISKQSQKRLFVEMLKVLDIWEKKNF